MLNDSPKVRCVIVAGMHRSGTSALGGVLHRAGVVMGTPKTFHPPPLPQNRLGFFENIEFRRINDKICRSNSYVVKSWTLDIPDMKAGKFTKWRARRLLNKYARRYSLFGFKDPRTCLTLSVWIEALQQLGLWEQTRLVHIQRDPEKVSSSLKVRGDCTIEAGRELVRKYETKLLGAMQNIDPAQIYRLTYENLMANKQESIVELCNFLGLEYKEGIEDALFQN